MFFINTEPKGLKRTEGEAQELHLPSHCGHIQGAENEGQQQARKLLLSEQVLVYAGLRCEVPPGRNERSSSGTVKLFIINLFYEHPDMKRLWRGRTVHPGK